VHAGPQRWHPLANAIDRPTDMHEHAHRGSGLDPSTDAWHVVARRGFWFWRGLGAVALAVGCAISLRTASGLAVALGVTGCVMFGVFAAYALRQGLRRRPRLTLGPQGVEAADLGVGPIPWTAIDAVQGFGSPEAPFVQFLVSEPQAWLARLPAWPRFVARLLRVQGLAPFCVNLIGVDRAPADIVRHATALHFRHG
jgi:hypothetical protein